MANSVESESFRIRREWAKKASQNFRFRHPEFPAPLYETASGFLLLVEAEPARFEALLVEFENSIRPLTCPMRLVQQVDVSATALLDNESYSSELWLKGSPLSVSELNSLLHLANPGLPTGSVDYKHEVDGWVFKSTHKLSVDEMELVKAAMCKVGLEGEILIEVSASPPQQPLSQFNVNAAIGLDILKLSNSFSTHSHATKRMIERDEDLWRGFINRRTEGSVEPVPERPAQFSCLFDTTDHSEVRLSELLTIYDRVDIIPARTNLDWLSKHGLSVDGLMQLVDMGRCRVVLPYGAEHCRPDVLDGLASIDSMPPILTRELAAKTFLAGQGKDPLLYAPFTAKQRSVFLHLIQCSGSSAGLQPLLASYGQIFSSQHQAFMLKGAMASMSHGIGSHLGEFIHSIRGVDARLELCTAGAGVEWAMALGSSWIPRSFGEEYDETTNSHLVASFISRTRGPRVDPVTSRLHAVTQGLLAVSGVPPLEVAKNFKGNSVTRFRTLARRLMHQAPSESEMLECVEQINAETRRFERRVERLTKWKVEALAAAVAAKPVGDAIDAAYGSAASIVVFYLMDVLNGHLPSNISEPLADIKRAICSFALAPSADAVVVSRAREHLSKAS